MKNRLYLMLVCIIFLKTVLSITFIVREDNFHPYSNSIGGSLCQLSLLGYFWLFMYELIKSHIARYIDLTDAEFNSFTSFLKHHKLRRKQYLLQAGDPCRYESFVIKGCLRTFSVDEKGQDHVLQFATEGWWAGDLHSFLTGAPSMYNIEALEETELLQLDKDSLEKLYKEIPKFERFFRLIIQNAFIALQQRVSGTMSEKAEDRYNDFINKYPDLEQRLPQRQLAAYLGITPEFLSRIRAKKR